MASQVNLGTGRPTMQPSAAFPVVDASCTIKEAETGPCGDQIALCGEGWNKEIPSTCTSRSEKCIRRGTTRLGVLRLGAGRRLALGERDRRGGMMCVREDLGKFGGDWVWERQDADALLSWGRLRGSLVLVIGSPGIRNTAGE